MAEKVIPNVLTIAGVDPSGGAGVLADIKTISALGGFGCGVIAALTAQNTQAVTGVCPVPASFVKEQLDTLFADVRIDAVKIGMLSDENVIAEVADALEKYQPRFVVLDPVMVAKSGDRLLPENCVKALKERLLPLATVLTPNLPEAAVLADETEIQSAEQMQALADKLLPLMGSAQKLHAQCAFLHGDVNQRVHFRLARLIGLKRERRRSKLQDRAVDARAIGRNVFQNIIQRTGHIQARGDACHRKHLKAKGRTPHFA